MNKRIILCLIAVFAIFCLTGCLNYTEENKSTNSQSEETVDESIYDELFGEKSYYYDNEKNIRDYVINYNNKASNKVTKVEWKNNHRIAYLYYNDEQCKINDHAEKGFIFTCDFKNGKSKISDYESIFKEIILIADSSIDENSINSSLEYAKNNNLIVTNITDKITIKYSYIEKPVSISAGDRYIIELIIGK